MKNVLLFFMILQISSLAQQTDAISRNLKSISGSISYEVWEYQGTKVAQKSSMTLNGKKAELQTDKNLWKCDISETQGNDGSVLMEARFRLEKGTAEQACVAINFNINEWSTANYVMIPSIVYNGNRYPVIYGGYMPPYPASMYYNKNSLLSFSDGPRLSIKQGEPSRIELSASSASTPCMSFFSPAKKQGFIVLTDLQTAVGNSGLMVEENDSRTKATLTITAPVVREKIPGFGGFFDSGDSAKNWKAGDEAVIRFKGFVFPANDIPALLNKFMDVRKSLSGPNHPQNLTPMSQIFKFTTWQTDHYRWDENYKIYTPGVGWSAFGYKNIFQLGWVGELMNTFPMIALKDTFHFNRVTSTFDFAMNRMRGASGFFYGIYADSSVRTEFRREIPTEIIKDHPDVKISLVRKNADTLLWLLKQFLLLKEQGRASLIKPEWEEAVDGLANAFVNTWRKYGELGQYIDPATGEIVIYNSTSGAIAPAGLALASKYFNKQEYLQAALEIGNFYYTRDVAAHGFTSGHCADISQDADSESAFGLLESFMALYWATADKEWLNKARVQAALCSSWTLSYDYPFPPQSDLARIGVHAAGAVFASSQNKHAAPGICNASGDYLFKLYRATGEKKYADLLHDIQHGHTEAVETPGRPTVSVGSGGSWEIITRDNYYGCSMERIQISDSEGKHSVGNLPKNTSTSWNECNGMFMAMEIPGIYLQTDKDEMYVFDHVEVKVMKRSESGVIIKITNPTRFDADVAVFSETSKESQIPMGFVNFPRWPKVYVKSKETLQVKVVGSGKISVTN